MTSRLILTAQQVAIVLEHMQPGRVLLGRILRQPFDGTNAEVSGALVLEFGHVPEASLPNLRAAITKATRLKPKRQPTPHRSAGVQGA